MGLYKNLPLDVTDVDVIIAGGGAAGCIVAGRLAEADPELSILLIESGPNNFGDPMVTVPAFWLSHTDPNDKYTWSYKASASHYLAGRESIVPAGRILGGGSSVNMLLYSRPQRSELDVWNTPGWSAEEILGYMKKWECYHGPPGSEDRHGHDGPLHVGPGNYRGKQLEDDFIAAVQTLGWPELPDNNTLDSINGSMRAQRYVGPDGKRQDTAHAYIHPKLQSGEFLNLHVLVETDVERVVFDNENKKAIGVAFRPSADFQPDVDQNEPARVIKARRQVVLSAGALGTPQILERSGVGNPDILAAAKVTLTASVPGVGENYLDHHIMLYPYNTSVGPDQTMDGLLTGRTNVAELIPRNDPLLSWNGVDVQCKLRPTEPEVASLGPEFQAAWNKDFKDMSDKPLMIVSIVSCFPGDPSNVPAGQYMGIATFSTHPFSRGRIHITGPSFSDPYEFDAGFLADENSIDLKKHFWMYKKQREIVRRMETFAGEVGDGHPSFPSGSTAASIGSKPEAVQAIEYTTEDDQAIEKFLKERISTTWHSMGTCKMAPLEEGGVVDPRLNVYGVQGLKIADLSIAPSNVGSNTCSVAMAVGEKAADIIIEELGLAK